MNQPTNCSRDLIRKVLKKEKADAVSSIRRIKRGLRELDYKVSQAYALCQSLQGADLFSYLKTAEAKPQLPNVRDMLESKQRHNKLLKIDRRGLQGVTDVLAWLSHVAAPMPPVEYIKGLSDRVRMKLSHYPYSDASASPRSSLHPRFVLLQSMLDEWHRLEVIEVLTRDGLVEGVDYDYDPVARKAVWRDNEEAE